MTRKTWLDKLCEPLLNPKYQQIKGTLCKRNGRKIIGKCAEGEIACQNRIKYGNDQLYLHGSQLIKLDIPFDLIDNEDLPQIYFTNPEVDFNRTTNIGEYIFCANDAGFTYPQIAEFLRVTFEDAV